MSGAYVILCQFGGHRFGEVYTKTVGGCTSQELPAELFRKANVNPYNVVHWEYVNGKQVACSILKQWCEAGTI